MKKIDDQSLVNAIASLSISTIQRLSKEGRSPGPEELASALATNKDLMALIGASSESNSFHTKEMLRLKKELDTLKGHFGKVDAKRRDLTHQLDTLESQNVQLKQFSRRAIPAIAQLTGPGGDDELQGHLDHLTGLLNNDASVDQLENALQACKDVAFREELSKGQRPAPPPKTTTFFNIFKRQTVPDKTDSVAHFKETYLEIIEELRLNLDQPSLEELSEIKTLLSGVSQLVDFLPIRGKILDLLKNYISRISKERKQAASFIFEVEGRLSEVEGQMLRSIAISHESRNANARFTDRIEKEMDAFHETVDFSKSLEDLKTRIMDRIGSIKKVIEASRNEDSLRDSKADKEVAILKKSLDQMKSEIKSAKKHSETLETELLTDSLTRAYNRRAYDQRITEELKRYHRYHNVFSLLILDVDHFKNLNDRFGHAVGDLCLKEIISRIKPFLRNTDFLARYGGEEFAIILPETTKGGAAIVAEKIRTHIENTEFLHKGEQVKITISLGGTQVRNSDKSETLIFERADKALYKAKQSGRNAVVML